MATITTSAPAATAGSFRPLQLGLRVLKAGPALILVALLIAFSVASPYFLTHHNLENLGSQSAIVGALGLGGSWSSSSAGSMSRWPASSR
jgi:ABC-type xylose transport system permease subunit